MSAEIIEKWLNNGLYAIVEQKSIKPVEHQLLKGKPLSSQKGQAEAFFFVDENNRWLVLKKFHSFRLLDRSYLIKIGLLLPRDPGFMCGTESQVLSENSLVKTKGCFYRKELAKWLDGTVLMPMVKGYAWSTIADEIRAGNINIDTPQRLILCKNLTRLIELLETCKCCHRDLSCGNIFIDINTWDIYLIDFGSFYHITLQMPPATTCGTEGYTAAYAWDNGKLKAENSWCEGSDRYALSLLNVEFLLVNKGTEATAEGGIFEQNELKKRSGNGINSIIGRLRAKYPQAVQLLERTINSRNCMDCPSPQQWNGFLNTISVNIAKPVVNFDALSDTYKNQISSILRKVRTPAPLWPAPSLEDIPRQILKIPAVKYIPPRPVDLPSDPWQKNTSIWKSIGNSDHGN
jgi:hypothetical protein